MYARREDYEKTILFFQKALAIQIEALGENHFLTALLYNYIGNAYDNKGDTEKALEYYNKSLEIQRNLGGDDIALGSPFSTSNIGSVYVYKGEYDKALDYFQESIRKWTKEHGEDNIELAKGYDQIGDIYQKNGELEKAYEYFQKSLDLRIKILDTNNAEVAHNYHRLAQVCTQQNKLRQALNYYQKSVIALVSQFADTNIYSNPPLENLSLEFELLSGLLNKAETFQRLYSLTMRDRKRH